MKCSKCKYTENWLEKGSAGSSCFSKSFVEVLGTLYKLDVRILGLEKVFS